jgi:inner membrane protein
VENLSHSLVGAALAEIVLPADATRTQRRIFFAAGIIAANLPDADLVYTRITPPPLGYLLHHRGHTHTVVGIAALALLMGVVCLLPRIRRPVGALRMRLWALIAVSLLGHLVMDSWNSYGVHPFWPFDVQWYYGDAIYIVEPWLWVLLGAAAALNTTNVGGRLVLAAIFALLAGFLVRSGMIPGRALAAPAAAAVVLAAIARPWAPRRRSGVALVLTALFVATMFGLRRRVRDTVLAAVGPGARERVVDVVLSPQPANPLCWSVLAIVSDERGGEYVMTRGTATSVGSSGCGASHRAGVEWAEPVHQALGRLRELHRRDCSARAWMQFGRAPQIGERAISDLRYGGTARENFSTMPLTPGREAVACPPNLTSWGTPRADLVAPAPTGPAIPVR